MKEVYSLKEIYNPSDSTLNVNLLSNFNILWRNILPLKVFFISNQVSVYEVHNACLKRIPCIAFCSLLIVLYRQDCFTHMVTNRLYFSIGIKAFEHNYCRSVCKYYRPYWQCKSSVVGTWLTVRNQEPNSILLHWLVICSR